jgi:glycosyltransferase involved in cell wall biosynthesis
MGQEKEELVSFIVLTYNVERYIKACLNSLLNQSCIKLVKEDFKNIYPRVKNYLDTKDKIKIFAFGLL